MSETVSRGEVALVSPGLVVQRNDMFTTGIVYMPVGLAHLAGSLRAEGFAVSVVDAFGESPRQARRQDAFLLLGLTPEEVAERVTAPRVLVYANQVANHLSVVAIIRALRRRRPEAEVVVLENAQAVTAYALAEVAEEFFDAGARLIVCGEPERRIPRLLDALTAGNPDAVRALDGVGGPGWLNPAEEVIDDLDALPLPAWDLFPLENYWSLRFAHGPQSSARYLPLLTSRGCPFACRFCVAPATNRRKWRARSARHVVDEMQAHVERFGVREFHIEDLDPTVDDKRTRAICEEILERGLDVTWKVVAGTKAETIRSEETVDLMARAGCKYVSISPETGSPRVLELMGKPFDLDHAVRVAKRMTEAGIRTQACFVLGFPGEEPEDLQRTREMVRYLTRQGVDEVALFIITPVPGSSIFSGLEGYGSLSELNFTPTWRADYPSLARFRLRLYRSFLLWKLLYHPVKLLAQPLRFLRRRFETKMEMVPYRALVFRGLAARAVSSTSGGTSRSRGG